MHNDVCVHIQIMLKEQTRETEKVEKQGDFLACQGFICGYMLAQCWNGLYFCDHAMAVILSYYENVQDNGHFL